MKRIWRDVRLGAEYWKKFLFWCLCAPLVGAIGGLVGAAFSWCLKLAGLFRGEYWPWLLIGLPLAGLLIVLLYRICGLEKDPSTNLVLASIREAEAVPMRLAPLIFVGTVLTQLCGGSAGREGAALQIGGSLGNFLARKTRLSPGEGRIVTMCGMSAVFAAIFGAPVTAMAFAMEVAKVGSVLYSAIFPCALAAILGYGVSHLCGVELESFGHPGFPGLAWDSILQSVAVAAVCAVVSILFCAALHWAIRLARHYLRNPYLRIGLGGVVIAGLLVLLGSRYGGAGQEMIAQSMAGQILPWDFLVKLCLTVLTIAAGFKGGEIIPGMTIGACLGSALAPLLGMDPGFGGAVGMIALFCGMVNCPLSAILLGVELLGGEGILYYAVAAAVSYLLSGYSGLYSGQQFSQSKLEPEKMD